MKSLQNIFCVPDQPSTHAAVKAEREGGGVRARAQRAASSEQRAESREQRAQRRSQRLCERKEKRRYQRQSLRSKVDEPVHSFRIWFMRSHNPPISRRSGRNQQQRGPANKREVVKSDRVRKAAQESIINEGYGAVCIANTTGAREILCRGE